MSGIAVAAALAADARVLFCPECGRRYTLKLAVLQEPNLKVLCGVCESVFRPLDQVKHDSRPPPVAAPAGRPTVVVAHESPAVCATVGRVLEEAGYTARYVHDGARAIAAFDSSLPDRPAALVLDVGIPEVMAFQVCQVLKQRPDASPHVVLLASVFERTRYKRRPTSLHGADGYVELHHVPDRLGPLIHDLMGHTQMPVMRPHLPVERARAEVLRPSHDPPPDTEAARALARRLVSDVALYHEASILKGMKRGQPLGEPDVSNALQEARQMFVKEADGGNPERMRVFDEAVKHLLTGLAGGRDPGA